MFQIFFQDKLWIDCVRESSNFYQSLVGFIGRAAPPREGLWFPDHSAIHTFFMKFSIDCYFLDARHRVMKANYDVPAWKWRVGRGAVSVLEVPSGLFSQRSIGDGLVFRKCA